MKKYVFGFLIFACIWVGLYQAQYGYLLFGYHRFWYTSERYESLVQVIDYEKDKLSKSFKKGNSIEQKEYLKKARQIALRNIPNLFKYWYGTAWDFNGTSETPGKGKIACGYFVTTVLRDAGFHVNRIKMAQMASEPFLKKIVKPAQLQRFYKISSEKFVEKVKKQGTGLFLVGLDTHIGFLWYEDENEPLWFVHSSGLGMECVKRENALKSRTLANSKYKVLAKLDEDEKFLRLWFK